MSSQLMPEAVSAANVYLSSSEFYGISDIQLPPFEALTATIKGGGLMGEIEVAMKGIFGDMVVEFSNIITVSDRFAELMEPKTQEIDIYANLQEKNVVTGEIEDVQLHIFIKGRPKNVDPGKLVQGEAAEASVGIGVDYILIERNGKQIVELDKYNWIYKVNGIDYAEPVRKNLMKG